MLVALLPPTLILHLLVQLPAVVDQAGFVLGVVAFGVGAFLILPADGEDEREVATHDPEPVPWWPEFEREFRAYSDRRVRV
jgi:hypothetical protein